MINYRFLFKCTLIIIVGAFNMQKKVSGEVYSGVSGLSVVSDHNLKTQMYDFHQCLLLI